MAADKELSYTSLGYQAKLGRNFVSQFMSGKNDPRIGNVIKLCHALGVSPEYILTGYQQEDPTALQAYKQFLALRERKPVLVQELVEEFAPEIQDNSTPKE